MATYVSNQNTEDFVMQIPTGKYLIIFMVFFCPIILIIYKQLLIIYKQLLIIYKQFTYIKFLKSKHRDQFVSVG